jgi:protein-disulfide isomerase
MTKSATGVGRSTRQRRNQGKNSVGIWIIGVSAAVVLLVVVAVALNNRSSATATVAPPDVPAEWINRTSLGNPEAPVTVEMWEDFLCPACRQWTEVIEPQLIDDYVKEGTVRLEFRHFPLQSHAPGSNMSAMASECAADQGGFWQYHSRLFLAQDRGQAGYTIDRLVEYADQIGLSGSTLLQCMSAQQHRTVVENSAQQALVLGLNATPSILVNGTRLANPFDYAELQAEIDAAMGSVSQ